MGTAQHYLDHIASPLEGSFSRHGLTLNPTLSTRVMAPGGEANIKPAGEAAGSKGTAALPGGHLGLGFRVSKGQGL